jgi:hypothetical protein
VLATIMRRYQPELTASGMPRPLAQITLRPGRRLPMRLRHRDRTAAVTAPLLAAHPPHPGARRYGAGVVVLVVGEGDGLVVVGVGLGVVDVLVGVGVGVGLLGDGLGDDELGPGDGDCDGL